MAPVRDWTSRDGSSVETAFICIAQGMLDRLAFGSGCVHFSLTCCLSERDADRMKAVAESNGA